MPSRSGARTRRVPSARSTPSRARRTQQELRRAEDDLNLLHTITRDVAAAHDFNDSLEIVLRRVCDKTGWAIGQAWVLNPERRHLECRPAWFAAVDGLKRFRTVSRATHFEPGVGLPGRVWASRQPSWIRDVTVDPNFPRAQADVKNGLKGAVGIPVFAGREVVAVIEFFVQAPREEDERLTRVIATIAAQLNLVLERKQTQDALRDREAMLRVSLARIRELAGRLLVAQEAERTRIARELHDDINQQLAGLSLMVSGLRRRLGETDAAGIEAQLSSLQQRIIGLVEGVRRLSHDLHPGVLKHVGLTAALESHCSEFQRQHGIELTFDATADGPPFPPDVSLCLFRATQEALRNIAAHAGARHVRVRLDRTDGHWTLAIADDGRGFDATHRPGASAGLGLLSMEERARLLHGQVRIDSAAGRGTTISISIPITAPSARSADPGTPPAVPATRSPRSRRR
jgi:signal transduction histidine kinase